ncbi:hypothetical protein JB92DRAFT_2717801, partial [Gautieria morchelliformis]
PLPRLLAVHLRRGDFEQHCAGLERDSAGWQGINEAEGLMDRYTPPLGGLQTPAEHAEFARHCWPSIDDVMRHVRRVRQEWEEGLRGRIERHWRLNTVYVCTNGDTVWWDAITSALRADGWEVRGSADMDFVRDSERIVGLAVDMEIAARAEVFIGNGWSTFTSNVNLLRMAHGAPPGSIRFW